MLPTDNPFAAPSELPLQFPPFDRIREEHYRPAIEQGMAEHLAEIEAIGADPAPPSFANTLEALERSGRLLDRVLSVFYNLVSSDSTDSLLAIEGQVSPRLAAHEDAIHLDAALFARIDELHRIRAGLGLEPEQLRLLERRHTDFVRAGAGLAEPDQQRLRSLNERLSTLTSTFSTRLLAETRDLAVHVEDRAELDGLADDAVAAAAQAARTRGLASGYLLTLVLPTAQPALASLTHRGLRQRLHEASVSRGLRGNEHDTREVITEIAALRAERAALLGFADHASYVVADRTAGTVDAVVSMLGALVGPAVENARAEAVELEAALHADGHEGPLQAWDWAFYAERVKAARFEVDEARLRPYFELHRVLHDGVFRAATALYGITFAQRHDLPVYHPDVTVFDVHDEDGSQLGIFICDWFARDSKRGGAWMSTFVDQARLLGTRPVVVVNLNVPRPPGDEPALMTSDNVRTAFHEFGHALHGLFSDVTYPRLSGTNVPRDFVEFPSQVNEMWAWWPKVLGSYARHHATGEPLPQSEVEGLLAANSYGEGFATVEYLGAALLDHEWHRLAPGAPKVAVEDVEEFERAALHRHGLHLDVVPPRYRSTYFQHAFLSGYDAGYYSYIWSEVLDADLVEWFHEHGGLRRSNGQKFRDRLLSRGGSADAMELFAAVRGRGPRIEPLLQRRGLTPAYTSEDAGGAPVDGDGGAGQV
jgi:peptidyl-dipeptidase Dcp